MTYCLLSLGSNLNHPKRQLRRAIQHIARLPQTVLLQTASFYRNPAWGKKSVPDYWNTVLYLKTTLTPFELLAFCQYIENRQGRIRKVRYGARTLDIDILSFGTRKLYSKKLTLPHPRMHERDFVQVPLNEIVLYRSKR